MQVIGGELPLKVDEDVLFTDSGRSSLRLLIRSGNQNKKFLIPNFFCEIIEDILKQEGVEYEFYNILPDLTIDISTVINREFDLFYSINYFGVLQKLDDILDVLKSKIVVEDNVFLYDFNNRYSFKKWFAFNSFRKISDAPDGSLIKSNIEVKKDLIIQKQAPFVDIKLEAKRIKYEYIVNSKYSQEEYLSLFNKGEELIDKQRDIFRISDISVYRISTLKSQQVQKEFFNIIKKKFDKMLLNKEVDYYSFAVLSLKDRDKLRKYLYKRSIFLPIHWPKSTQNNILYDNVISIPLFNYYTKKDIEFIANSIGEFYETDR